MLGPLYSIGCALRNWMGLPIIESLYPPCCCSRKQKSISSNKFFLFSSTLSLSLYIDMMSDGFLSDVTGDIYPRKMDQEAKVHWLFQTLISLGKRKRSKAEGPRDEERAWAIIYTEMIDIYLYTRASYMYRLCLICRGLKVVLSLGKLRALYSNCVRQNVVAGLMAHL